MGYSTEKIKLILNRYIPDDEITPEDVAETVEHPIFWKISNNYRVIMTAINRGIPIKAVEGGIEMHKQFTGLARLITGRVGSGAASVPGSNSSLPQKRSSLLGGLMDKLNKG